MGREGRELLGSEDRDDGEHRSVGRVRSSAGARGVEKGVDDVLRLEAGEVLDSQNPRIVGRQSQDFGERPRGQAKPIREGRVEVGRRGHSSG
jgi:hypothetical protein